MAYISQRKSGRKALRPYDDNFKEAKVERSETVPYGKNKALF